MTSFESGWTMGPSPPMFLSSPDNFGRRPQVTVGQALGPVFDENGRQVRGFTPEEGWSEFFGKPRKPIEKNLSDDLEKELFDLPEAYKGTNSYISQILISRIANTELWILKEFAPWIKFEDAMDITWDIWSFQDHMLGRTPEESVSRLLTTKVTSGAGSMVRWGIALMLEHGFFNTPKGRKNYQMNIQQIQNAIVETAAFGAMHAALTALPADDPNALYRLPKIRNRNGLDDFFADELYTWGMLQKSEDGFVNMVAKMKDAMEQRAGGVNPDLLCLPNGTRKYLANLTLNQPFAMTGLKPGETRDPVGNSYLGLKIRESRYFRQGEHRPAIDPAYQERTIGEFFQMGAYAVSAVDAKDFRTHMLDTKIYNEDRDEMEMFKFAENFKYLGLFENFGNESYAPLSHIGKKYFAGFSNWHSYIQATSPYHLDYIVKGIVSKDADTQAKFTAAMLGSKPKTAPANPFADSRAAGPSFASGRTYGSGMSGTRTGGGGGTTTTSSSSSSGLSLESKGTSGRAGVQQSTVSASDLIQMAQAKFAPSPAEIQMLTVLLERLADLDNEDLLEGRASLLFKAKGVLDSLNASGATDLAVRVQTALADDILAVDLDRSARDITSRAAAGINPTPLETAFGQLSESRWPSPITNDLRTAEQNSPVWKIDSNGGSRAPISVYEGPTRSKTLPLHSQIFTLTSTHATLIRIPPFYLNKLKQGDTIQTDSDDSDRVGFLQYSIALSALFELFKNSEKLYSGTRDQAKKQTVLTQLYTDISKIAEGWDMYNEQFQRAAGFRGLECQFELSAIIRPLKQLIEAHGRNQLDEELCKEIFMSFIQHYNTFFSANNASYTKKQTAMAARFHTAHTNKTTQVLRSSDLKEDAFEAEAAAAVKGIRTQVQAQLQKEGKEHCDSFDIYGDNYVQLYQVYKARGWDLKGWAEIVKASQAAYVKDGTGESSRNLLDLIFSAAADRDAEPVIANLKALKFDERAQEEKEKFDALLVRHGERLKWDAKVNSSYSSDDEVLTGVRKNRRDAWNNSNASLLNPRDRIVYDVIKKNLDLGDEKAFRARVKDAYGSAIPNIGAILLEITCLTVYNSKPADLTAAIREVNTRVEGLLSISEAADYARSAKHLLRGGDASAFYRNVLAKWGLNRDSTKAAENVSSTERAGAAVNPLTNLQVVELLKAGAINGEFPLFCLRNDVLPPCGYRGVWQGMTYLAGTAWMAEGNGKCASTLFGHADFQLADDAARKIHYGHFTMYNKTFVWSNEKIIHAPNVFIKQYKGGHGSLVYDPLNPLDIDSYHRGDLDRDIHLFPTPIGCWTNSKHIDITGSYHKSLGASAQAQADTHIFRMEPYCAVWRWTKQNQRDPLENPHIADANPKTNTICFQGHQQTWHAGKKDYSVVIQNKGHWGPNVYSGCGQTRKGGAGAKTLLHCNFDNGTSVVTITK